MAKIPKNRSDKEMLAGYQEAETLEESFHKAAKAQAAREAAEKAKEAQEAVPPNLLRAGFSKDLTDALGKALMELKLELAQEGITRYTFKVKREGESIILTPKKQ